MVVARVASSSITNESTLIDIEFVDVVLKGGTLAGKIVNYSHIPPLLYQKSEG
jgi:hypothetical protein